MKKIILDDFGARRDIMAALKCTYPTIKSALNFKSNTDIVLNRLMKISIFYEPKIYLNIIKDSDDNKLLELAEESNADFLITGNHLDFNITHYNNTRILSPRDFWENFRRNH